MKQQQKRFMHRFFWTTLVTFGCFLPLVALILYGSPSFAIINFIYIPLSFLFVAVIIGGVVSVLRQRRGPTKKIEKVPIEPQTLSLPYEFNISGIEVLWGELKHLAPLIVVGIVMLFFSWFHRLGVFILIYVSTSSFIQTGWMSYGFRAIRFSEDGIRISKNKSDTFFPWSDIRAFDLTLLSVKKGLYRPPLYTTLYLFVKARNGDPYSRMPIPCDQSFAIEDLFVARSIEKSRVGSWRGKR